MAGYFTRNNGDVFEGEFPCAEQGGIKQGLFCKNDADGVKAVAIYDDGTKGVFSAQITTAFADGDTLAVNDVVYTLAAQEDVAAKKFAGITAANQATSLAKMVKADNFTVAADTDKLVFTQVLQDEDDTGPVLVAGAQATGVVGSLVEVTPAVDPALIADLGYRFVVVELTKLNGAPAVRANVTAVGSNQIYFAEQAFVPDESPLGPDFVIEEGELVRMRRPQVGDQIVVNVASHSGLTVRKVMKIANGTGLLVAA